MAGDSTSQSDVLTASLLRSFGLNSMYSSIFALLLTAKSLTTATFAALFCSIAVLPGLISAPASCHDYATDSG